MDNFFEGLPILVGMAMEWIRGVWVKFVSSKSNPFYDRLLIVIPNLSCLWKVMPNLKLINFKIF